MLWIVNPEQFALGGTVFLSGAAWKLFGDDIKGGLPAAAAYVAAQAAAERRRWNDSGREAAAGGDPGLFGRTRAAYDGMHGPRPGTGPGSHVPPGSGPFRRLAGAAAAGGRAGARKAAATAAERNERRRAERENRKAGRGPAGTGPGRGDGSTAPGGSQGTGRSRRRDRDGDRSSWPGLAPCDDCNVMFGDKALTEVPVERPGGTQMWKVCDDCLTRRTGKPDRPAGPAVGGPPPSTAIPAGTAPGQETRPLPGPDEEHTTLPGGSPALDTSDDAPAIAAGSPDEIPSAEENDAIPAPEAPPELPASTGPAAGGVPAAAEPVPGSARELPAAAGSEPGQDRIPVLAGHPAGGHSDKGQGVAMAGARPITRGAGTAVAVRGGGAMTSRAGDSRQHGGADANVRLVIAAIEHLRKLQAQMVSDLQHAEGSESQIEAVRQWSLGLTSHMNRMLNEWGAIDSRIMVLVRAVEAAGGVKEVGSPGYHSDI